MKKKILSWLLILCMVLTAIPFSMVSASAEEATNISMSGMTYPSGTLNKGDLFVLRGTIFANKNIQRIEIGIVKDGKWVAGHKVDQTVNSKSFNVLQKADSKIKFGDLSEGNYSYRCWVWIDGKSNRIFDKPFTVAAGVPKITLSGVSYPSGTLNKGDLFVLRGTISANKNIQRIEIGIVKDEQWVAGHKVDQKINAKSYNILQSADSKIKFGDLGEGVYKYRCWIWIDGKRYAGFDRQFTVTAGAPKITLSEVSYPSGSLNKGDLFVLRGTISANKNIQRIEIGIVKDGKWVAGHKVDQAVNAKSFNILQKADSKIKFGDLAEGNYSYRCWVWIDGKSNKAFNHTFTVKEKTGVSFSWPSSTHTITGKWGLETGHTQKYLYGIDIGANGGSAVKAAAPGTVICAGLYQGYGYCVQVKHSNGKVTLYGHMRNSLQVKKGATVSRGQVLGYVGGTGYAGKKVYAEHLHFGIYKSVSALSREYGSTASAVSYNPLNYLP